jgi:hypothetical protein
LVLPAVLAILSAAALSLGQSQPPSDWFVILHLNECALPCWIGIVPGITSKIEAQRRIEAAFSDSGQYSIREDQDLFSFQVVDRATGQGIYIRPLTGNARSAEGEVIEAIELYPQVAYQGVHRFPTIPELYSALGGTTAVRVPNRSGINLLVIAYQETRVLIFTQQVYVCNKLALHQEIGIITLYSQSTNNRFQWLFGPQRWRGFGHCYFPYVR